jgi:hypothetical protein
MSHPESVDPDTFFSVLLTRPDDARAFGALVVDLLEEHTPEWVPARWGFGEPAEPADRGHMLEQWAPGIMWTGAADRRILGSWFAPPRLAYATLQIDSPPGLVEGDRIAALLRAVAAEGAVYGLGHRLLPADLTTADRRVASITTNGASLRAGERRLAEVGIPDVWWANIFGPPVVDLLGAERIASAPAAVVEPLGEDRFYLQLTDSILDGEADPTAFEVARAKVKAHLGPDAFYDPARPPGARARAIILPQPAPRPARPAPSSVSGFGPAGYLNAKAVKSRWEPWARGTRQPDVYSLTDLPAAALVALADVLPAEQLDAEVDDVPTLRAFAQIAEEAPDAVFSGQVVGPEAKGTESLSIVTVSLPDGASATLEALAGGAARDELSDEGIRVVSWR